MPYGFPFRNGHKVVLKGVLGEFSRIARRVLLSLERLGLSCSLPTMGGFFAIVGSMVPHCLLGKPVT